MPKMDRDERARVQEYVDEALVDYLPVDLLGNRHDEEPDSECDLPSLLDLRSDLHVLNPSVDTEAEDA